MAPKTVGIRALREELPEMLRQVGTTGQPLVVTKHGEAVATIVPGAAVEPPDADAPRIIAVVSLKGGVGKTTLTMHLAAAIAQERDQVVVLDADEEVSAFRWQQHAAAEGLTLPFKVIPAERNTLMRQARELAKTGVTVLIDTPPNNREILKSAATVADVVLVPVLPTGMDVDRLATTLELLADLEAALDNFNYAIILNRFDSRKGMAHEANEALNAHPRLNTVVKSLSAYEKVFGQAPAELSQFHEIWQEIKQALGSGA
ncbi:cobyrinic acid ac-diamide synthase [Deinococcus aerius]|uniref:Cobyrinic acid ac-diamide synthase n=3 Tax=Deinococcus TaxID=1298 RepID=A0A2I9CSN7_9DEIO|nr:MULTISPECIES: type II toxin-antitoxin system prevent-host-death family antitoxin [Deinococcus]MBB5293840.1 chromosome partitioning protein [Deinococcus metallilatus]GBF04702.1 cobyrinic acid ac-diamide synthase [Deinococcus aerius]